MTDWIGKYNADWLLEWLGPCETSTFGYSFPITFDWSSQCDVEASLIPPFGLGGLATIVPDLENGFTVTHEWVTDVIPRRDGTEQRIARNDVARQSFEGSVVLLGENVLRIRALMAQTHLAQPFLLALPHEALSLSGETEDEVVPVHSSTADWAMPGQRVVVCHDETIVEGVIQSVDAASITLDVSPSLPGGEIMPLVPVYLEPQQDFPRYPVNAERWEISGRFAQLDFAPQLASLSLGPVTTSAALENAVVTSRLFGLIGNTIDFALDGDAAYPAAGELVEVVFGTPLVIFRFQPGVTTVTQLYEALLGSQYVMLSGHSAGVLQAGDECGEDLTGAEDAGRVGVGAVIETYEDHPVWTPRLDGDVTDGVHSLIAIVDHGGAPYAVATSDSADWYRTVNVQAGDWQYLKKFLHTVKGRQKSWWLPSWRDDLPFVSAGVGTITVEDVDFATWWPALREHIQIVEDDGTITYAKVTAAVNNGDGTRTLTVGVSVAGASLISWMELCRFDAEEAEEFAFTFQASGVEL